MAGDGFRTGTPIFVYWTRHPKGHTHTNVEEKVFREAIVLFCIVPTKVPATRLIYQPARRVETRPNKNHNANALLISKDPMRACSVGVASVLALLLLLAPPVFAKRTLFQSDALSNSNGCLATIPKCEQGACATRNIMGTARWVCLRCMANYEPVVDGSGQDNIIQCGEYRTCVKPEPLHLHQLVAATMDVFKPWMPLNAPVLPGIYF